MNKEDKELILEVQSIIDLILEKQNMYAIDRDLMFELNNLFTKYENHFDNQYIVHYLDFIEIFSSFFDMLIERLKDYENELIEEKGPLEDCYFVFNFNEFKEKEVLLPYQNMLDILNDMFPKKRLLQGIIFYMHLNSLLRKYKFKNNKIRYIEKKIVIDIDYADRISYYKEEYITNFRRELEEGIRIGVFLDDNEIYNYVKEEIKRLEHDLDI